MLRIALTCGEPAGIGPDLCVLAAQNVTDYELVAIGNQALLAARAKELSQKRAVDKAGTLCVADVALGADVQTGTLNSENAAHVLRLLDVAANGCADKTFDAMVTAPVHKGVINDAGIAFTGHTEYLADKSDSDPVMLLAAGDFRVALATTHLPLSAVPAAITEQSISRVLHILHTELQTRFAIHHPRILVCGLNPHAGEDGHLGREELDVIIPCLEKLRAQGLNLTGPLPADTLFTQHHLNGADAVLAMFHDQGLPVLKYAGFGESVNITLGLPIIRTSVDHGTAIDKAGTGNIDSGSLQSALTLAVQMAQSAKS
ncbi:UNVERIFIED_CONTAM: hypothetical protein GTU68_054648 [Idotea baltica]|nr:hypothetical protein [Idotea baltica]